MGVPTFFKWLTVRYPKVVVNANESSLKHDLPAFDNIYIDMNGIIHPCCNPPSGPKPQSEDEMFDNIFKYIDKLVQIVRPRKLIYMAIDGVAPRAKMNQQRARRFRKVQEEREKAEKDHRFKESLAQEGVKLANSETPFKFDSNVITPGTPFMNRLSEAVHKYILRRLSKKWKGLTVIFSDANNPGEGEHKLLEFIRAQRTQVGYDSNLTHVIYGADADLIMLALITHEPNFYIIRESIMDFNTVTCRICGQAGHFSSDCKGEARQKQGEFDEQGNRAATVEFQFLRIPVLREYLYYEFEELKYYPNYNFERIIDDFVFLCFFVGNDFLPHLPTLHIRDGAIDGLVYLYTRIFHRMNGYLTENGTVVLHRVDILFAEIAKIEDEWFQEKHAREEMFKNRDNARKRKAQESEGTTEDQKNEIAAKNFQDEIEQMLQEEDKIRYGEEGWKLRYYKEKFKVGEDEYEEFRQRIHKSYIEGICWVFSYYYNGCQSWGWYFPFHYAPLASDLLHSHLLDIDFKLSVPFSPFAQLLSVLPPASIHALPRAIQSLVVENDSEIIDFYPEDFTLDTNGKRFSWQGVMLLPFIEESRLIAALSRKLHLLTDEEKERNGVGDTIMYFSQSNLEINVRYINSTPRFSKYSKPISCPVQMWVIENLPKGQHASVILPGTQLPKPEVDRHVFQCGNRRGFGGLTMINMISRSLSSIPEARVNVANRIEPMPQWSESFNNNRAVCLAPTEKRIKPNDEKNNLIANLQKLVNLLKNPK